MKKTQDNLIILNILFVVGVTMTNVCSSKLMYTGIILFGVELTMPCGFFSYAITFLTTDIIGEIWGKKESNSCVIFGLLGQVCSSILLVIACAMPTTDTAMQAAFTATLGQSWLFVTASLVGFFVSENWDVFIFHKIRDKYLSGDNTSTHAKWLWNNGSTMTSQILDTFIWSSIAFGLGQGWYFDPILRKQLFLMMIGQYIVKALFALFDTPFFYFFTRRGRQDGENWET